MFLSASGPHRAYPGPTRSIYLRVAPMSSLCQLTCHSLPEPFTTNIRLGITCACQLNDGLSESFNWLVI